MSNHSKVDTSTRLSPLQEHVWLLQHNDSTLPYRATAAIWIEGSVERDRLREAIGRVVRRHEILRSSFSVEGVDDTPVQSVLDGNCVMEVRERLVGLGEEDLKAGLDNVLEEQWNEPLDLNGCPLRLTLLPIDGRSQLLLLTLPALCADGPTLSMLATEILKEYAGVTEQASEVPLQYGDVALWLSELLESEDTRTGREYWKKPARETGANLCFPFQPSIKAGSPGIFEPRDIEIPLDESVLPCIRKHLDAGSGLTLPGFLQAAWACTLSHLCGETHIQIGVLISGRRYEQLQGVFGLLDRRIPVRISLESDPAFDAIVRALDDSVAESSKWQEYLAPRAPEILDKNGTYFAGFEFREWPNLGQENGMKWRLAGMRMVLDRFVANLVCTLSNESLRLQLFYDSSAQNEEDMRLVAECLATVLESAAKEPRARLSHLPFLPDTHRTDVLRRCAGESIRIPESIGAGLFEDFVAKTPDAVAVRYEGSDLSYQELDARANRCARWLNSVGVRQGDHVAVCFDRCPDMLVAILAVWKAGAAYVPLDPAYPVPRLQAQLANSESRVLITHAHLNDSLRLEAAVLLYLDSPPAVYRQISAEPFPSKIEPDALAYIIYTSGSRGAPQGVGVTHGGVRILAAFLRHHLCSGSPQRVLQYASWSSDASVCEILMALATGGSLHLADSDRRAPGAKLADLLEAEGITIATLPPAVLGTLPEREFPELKTLIADGEACVESVVERWSPGRRFFNAYGLPEATVWATIAECFQGNGKRTIGRPLANLNTFVVDANLALLPECIPGELCIAGEGLARGYFGQPSLTAERFVPDPWSAAPGARMYRTGDRVRMLRSGELEFHGRMDEQVKLRGFRVELQEVRAALCRHSSVLDATVTVRPGPDGSGRLVAYAVCRDGFSTVADLHAYLDASLPDYMVPSAVVILPSLPLTAHGRVDLAALPEPEAIDYENQQSYVPPRSQREELLAAIWKETLDIARVGIYDSFFNLGGHSIAAVQMISRIRDVFNIEVPVRSFFDSPTIAGLAHAMDAIADAGGSPGPVLPSDRSGDLPLSFSQQEMWLVQQLDPGSPAYNIPLVLRLRGKVQLDILRECLNRMVQRHESLRTTFHLAGDRVVQTVQAAAEVPFENVDLRQAADPESVVRDMVARQARKPIDLEHGPLLHARFFRMSEDDQALFLLTHHIVFDAPSLEVFIGELRALYDAYSNGRQATLPQLPIQYGDYAVWQRNWLQGEQLQTHLDYWKSHLGGHSGLLAFPSDRPRTEAMSSEGGSEAFSISKELSDKLRALSVREKVTLFMTTLATFYLLLYRYSSDEDIVVGTPATNRDRIETEGLIGLVMNILAIRTAVRSSMTFAQLLAKVRESCLGALSHQDLPFELVVQTLRPNRKMASSPIFQTMFTLQTTGFNEKPVEGIDFDMWIEGTGTAKTDISMDLIERSDGLRGLIMYRTALFDAATIRRMARHYEHLLEQVVNNPERELAGIDLVTPEERHELLVEWNGVRRPEILSQCLHQVVEQQARTTPDSPAIKFGDRTLSYREANGKANAVAIDLLGRETYTRGFVPVLMNNSLELPIAYLGIMKSGGAFVPLDPGWPQGRIARILEDLRAPFVLVNPETIGIAEALQAHWILVDDAQLPEACVNPELPCSPDQPIYAIYTSGSTGKPKGAINLHKGILNRLLYMNQRFEIRPQDTVLQLSVHVFDASIWQFFWPLINGARVVVPPSRTQLDFAAVVQFVEDEHVTATDFVPSLLNLFVDYLEGKPENALRLSSLRHLLIGGEALTAATAYRLHQLLPAARLTHTYGPTETSIGIAMYDLAEEIVDPIPLGRPIDNTYVLVLDKDCNLVPAQAPGELYIGGECLGAGYFGDQAATDAAFIPNPFPEVASTKLYRTGDRGLRLRTGDLQFLGRSDNQIKVSGIRIELGEIETALLAHPSVSAATIAYKKLDSGEQLIAYVVPEEKCECLPAELHQFLHARLPEYMLPSAYVSLAALPLNISGKLDRQALPDPDAHSRPRGDKPYAGPSDAIELQLLGIWEETLGVQGIGIDDNFFDLGGHSLVSVHLMAKVQEYFGVHLNIAGLFREGTPRHMAAEIRTKAEPEPWTPLVPLQPLGSRPPLFFIHPLGGSVFGYVELARSLGTDQPFYALQALRLDEIGETGDVYGSIEAMAADYVELIKTVQPCGPYHLGGWSMGGVIALEMAQQLLRAGDEMGLLAILDTIAPHKSRAEATSDAELLWGLARERAVMSDRELSVNFEDLQQVVPEEQLAFLLEQFHKTQFLAPEADLETIKRYVHGFRYRDAMVDQYRTTTYPGQITLFRAAEVDSVLIQAGLLDVTGRSPTYGWEDVGLEPLLVREIQGTHATITKQPNVRQLAAELTALVKERIASQARA